MKYKLINEMNKNYTAIEQILFNRGIAEKDFFHYLNTTDADINAAEALGEEKLKAGATALIQTIKKNGKIFLVVDSDADGYTSSALLLNYLHDSFPAFVENNIIYYIHTGKEHGLKDCINLAVGYDMVILPDSSSNDYSEHEMLKANNIPVLILDHHEAEKISPDAIVINNQLSDYPNKDFSGVGIVWQFCKYLDKLLKIENADNYLDLVALGNCADMMSLKSIETKHLMNKGFKQLKNPFFSYMADKNSFSLGSTLTPMGVAFYVVPFINAMQRSGTQEEKELLFKSMLSFKAFESVPSTKRGHKAGEMEKIVEQAVRTVTNVKNRQTRAQDACMELLEKMIIEQDLLQHKVLLFLLEPGLIDKNIAGLCANKIMAKYQRPCCILTKVEETSYDPIEMLLGAMIPEKTIIKYQGSARNYDKSGILNFKDICTETGLVDYAEGHQGAFGLSLPEENIQQFLEKTDIAFENMSPEPLYLVDYIYKGVDVKPDNILDIAGLNDIWGQGMEESFIAIENLKVSKETLTLMGLDKGKPTLKITLPNKISLIKFGSSQEEYNSLYSEGYVSINVVGRCNANEWMGRTTPQVLIEEFEIVGMNKYNF